MSEPVVTVSESDSSGDLGSNRGRSHTASEVEGILGARGVKGSLGDPLLGKGRSRSFVENGSRDKGDHKTCNTS